MGDKNPKAKVHANPDRMPRINTRSKKRTSRSTTTATSSNPTPPAPSVIRAREKAAKALQTQKPAETTNKLAQEIDFRTAQIEFAIQHSDFQALQPGTMERRVAVDVLAHFVLVEPKPGEKRLWCAYQAARRTLNVVQRQTPKKRETAIWWGRQVADTALTWAYTQLTEKETTVTETIPTGEIVGYAEFVFGAVPVYDYEVSGELDNLVDLDKLTDVHV